jgi:hypothetical protein
MGPEYDLGRLIDELSPRLDPQPWVFVTVARLPAKLDPLMTFREDEGLTCIIRPEEATALGLSRGPAFRRISLGVASSLEAVGLTAAVASALTAVGISANIVAAFHHDHVFVPEARAAEALARLELLRQSG